MTVGVVGAGITGLALTHYLRERDVNVVTFDARDAAGGVIQSQRRDGHVVELGPQRMRATPGIRELAAAAGVESDIVTASEGSLFVYSRGRLREAPTDVRPFLRTDLLSWPEKLRFLAEPLTQAAQPQETVAEVFSRKFGQAAYERFVGPLYGGLYASDPSEMPAKFALEGLMRREQEAGSLLSAFRQRVGSGEKSPAASFPDGLQTLPEALADTYADSVHLAEPVETVESTPDGYTLDTTTDEYAVDDVVVTTPANAAAELLDNVADGTDALEGLTYNPLVLVYLETDGLPEGLGYQVAYDEDLRTLGVSFNGAMFDRDELCTAFLGGMHDPEILAESDERLGEIATTEFERATGQNATVVDVVRRDRWFPAYDQTWWGLEDVQTPEGVHLATNYTARMGIPSRVREARQLAEELSATTA
ncbi:protoporphyrinogen oxidase [Salinibaculum rarum]|uniref:protoporphyrinogen oxidase n=1 Tax=Salinibaculum rarum TaxID=3058903 RepID=UPI00265EA0A5|nr:protoporphyrinogen oxidase [Salinibaculum sp. KK48]